KREPTETLINGRPVVGGSAAAAILTERARAQGSNRTYSRDNIYRHYRNGRLKAAVEGASANLYYREDIENLPISPGTGKRSASQKETPPETSEQPFDDGARSKAAFCKYSGP